MSIPLLLVCLLLLGAAWAVLLSLCCENTEETAYPDAFAVLPVPEDTPAMRAYLQAYAAQILWMDAHVLQRVILVCTRESEALCRDMAQHYSCYTVMTLTGVQGHIAGMCRANSGKP